jgi:hypothetical protein
VPELTEYVYGVYPPVTLLNGLKLVIVVLTVCDTVVVAPAVAVVVAFTVKLTLTVVLATTLLTSFTLNTTLAAAYVTVGVPDTKPELGSILTPVGNVPELT